jgi:MYXO-CTERM domain-containing protein
MCADFGWGGDPGDVREMRVAWLGLAGLGGLVRQRPVIKFVDCLAISISLE